MSEIDPQEIADAFTAMNMWVRCAECGEKMYETRNGKPWCIFCKKTVKTK